MTVLFADVVHSMDIAAKVGAERLREIMADLADRCAAVVQRYGGTVDKFTGDGIMAVFGAPIALEDHAVRACLAALGVQDEAKRLAVEAHDRDGVDLQLRVGLNSGQAIAGDIGSGALGYTTMGEQVGMAQRMESVAPPGGVMLSQSTAHLVEQKGAVLSKHELVHIKGVDAAVPARRLLAIEPRHGLVERVLSSLVGRRWEMAALEAILDRSIDGHGAVVGVVGPPGIGKSRVAREAGALAGQRRIEVFWTFCESHASEISFHVVTRLLRAAIGVGELDGEAARAQVRVRVPDADEQDLVLLHDLLGIRDPAAPSPKIDPDARRRRLTAMINAAQLARPQPAVYIIEDAHWIDEASESMLADFITVIPQTRSMVLITYRPEYQGALARVAGAQTIALGPLGDSDSAALIAELLGSDPSVDDLAAAIAERAAGNPFFVEEIVRDLAERDVLHGKRGAYVGRGDVAEVHVPATLQATIAARIDRLDPRAKQTLSAASVIGSRFSPSVLSSLGIDPVLHELVKAELIDQVRVTPQAEYAFCQPLIRTVAYESQLKSDRAELHRRLAAAIEQRAPGSADENAALIAGHLEAAGELHAAYDWHMRAGTWSTNRDTAAACLSWERARRVADALSADEPNRIAMRIAPRTLLCGNAWRVHENIVRSRFEELRQLCGVAGDKASLAIGMAGLMMDQWVHAHIREASRLASEYMALVESIGDPALTVGLAATAIPIKYKTGEIAEMLQWSQTAIELADGDPAKGGFIFGSPLAVALATRGIARWWLGRPGWRDDFDHAIALAHETDPLSHATVIVFKYVAIAYGVLPADKTALHEIDEALQIAEGSADDFALGLTRLTKGLALMYTDPPNGELGVKLLGQLRDMCLHKRFYPSELPLVEIYTALDKARRGDIDHAIPRMRRAVDDYFHAGQMFDWFAATAIFVETLLSRGADGDVAEAEAVIDRLGSAQVDNDSKACEIWLLRLRTLLARAHGDETGYRDYRDRYRAMATSLGFEGHMAWAEAMP